HTRCYRDWSSDVCSSDLHAAVLLGRGLDRMHDTGLGEPVGPFGDVAGRVDVADVGTQVVVDDDALIHADARALEPLEIGADARGHDDDVAHQVAALGELQPLLALDVLDL